MAPDRESRCLLIADTSSQLDTLTVALLEPVDPGHVLAPSNDSERLFFRNLTDNLVRLDCEGVVRPGIAESWARDETQAGWIMALREDANHPTMGPISAGVVARDLAALSDGQHARGFGIVSAHELTQQRLRIIMNDPITDSAPRFLADPALAVTGRLAPDSGTGKGSLQIPAAENSPVIEFRFPSERDARDALDQDVDLVVTRSPGLVDYVSRNRDFVTFPLPWSRTYVLVEIGEPPGTLAGILGDSAAKASLAKDAVRAQARIAEPPYWWESRGGCPIPTTPSPKSRTSRVVYREDDEVARGLAERLVALADPAAGLQAQGVEAAEFSARLGAGTERAYILGLPRQSVAPCRDGSSLPLGAVVLPLIDTRAQAIVRRGAPPLAVEWDGTLRIGGP